MFRAARGAAGLAAGGGEGGRSVGPSVCLSVCPRGAATHPPHACPLPACFPPRPLHAAGRSGAVTRRRRGYKAPARRPPAPQASRRLRLKQRTEEQRESLGRGGGGGGKEKKTPKPEACSSLRPSQPHGCETRGHA